MATQTRLQQRMDQLTIGDLIRYFEFHNRTEGKSQNTAQECSALPG